jgi:pyroglutamyl-peptidase
MPNQPRAPVLLTGFDPFAGEPRNPSAEAVALLTGTDILGHNIVSLCLPTAFGLAAKCLLRAVERLQPAVVIASGVAAGRSEIAVERFALNFEDARIPDNRGQQPRDRPIVPGAPLAYASTLPVTRVVARLREAGIPAAASMSAGTFVCNQVFYRLCHALSGSAIRAGFVHMPHASEHVVDRVGMPSLPLITMAEALRLTAEVTLRSLPKVRQAALASA